VRGLVQLENVLEIKAEKSRAQKRFSGSSLEKQLAR
jgi:hypothetical protein